MGHSRCTHWFSLASVESSFFYKIYTYLLGPERKVIVGDISALDERIVAEFIDCSYVSCSFVLI